MRIRSELELSLPSSTDAGRTDADWDVDVRRGPDLPDSSQPPPGDVIAAYELGGVRWYTAVATETGYLMRFRDCGDFEISSDLATVIVRADRDARPDMLPILMAGTVGALILTLRGQTVLHASAVAVGDRALAFVGQSGRGKSTLAALLCTEGAQLVTDDVLTVEPGPPATCRGGAAELRLRPAAAEIARNDPRARSRTTADDRLAYAADRAPDEPLALGAIVIPEPSRTATEVTTRVVPANTAMIALLAFPRVHGWTRSDVLRRDFETVGRLVDQLPIYAVTIPWGPPFRDTVGQRLRELAQPDAEHGRSAPTTNHTRRSPSST